MDWQKFKKQKERKLSEAVAGNLADERIIPLLRKINENENLVTSSSCSGRIALLSIEKGKKDANFYKKWHRAISENELTEIVEKYNFEKPLWFRCEPFILHVFAKDIKSAGKFLKLIRNLGIKRGGIQTINEKGISIEIQGNGNLIFPIGHGIETNWKLIVKYSNEIIEKNFEKILEIEKALK
ncbi:MAG: hypothetical protein WC501_03425 [Candidatus Micrarchaeia archaeon]